MKTFFIFLLIFLSLLSIDVFAHCPLCTGAIGVAAVSAKYYGLDVSVIGIFIGAFAISTGLWIGRKIKNYFKFQTTLIVIASFLLTVIPLMAVIKDTIYFPLNLFGSPGSLFQKVYWLNKLLIGSIIGSLATLFAFWLHLFIKKTRQKVLFPYQGIVLTIVLLALTGVILYSLTK